MDNPAGPANPPGELVPVEGKQMHVRLFGQPSKPLLLLECGLTMMSSCWGWLAPELAKGFRVLAYDRSGLGWSEEREGLRTSAQIARELKPLLLSLSLDEPFVYLGHSMGAMHARAFHKLYPQLISAMIFLDPAHPDQLKRVRRIRYRMRNLFFFLDASAFLARNGLAGNWNNLPFAIHLRDLPQEERDRLHSFLRNPRHLRTTTQEVRAWDHSAEFLKGSSLGSLPLLVISAQKNALPRWEELQSDLATLSPASKRIILTNASHLSLLGKEEHAIRVAEEIRSFLIMENILRSAQPPRK